MTIRTPPPSRQQQAAANAAATANATVTVSAEDDHRPPAASAEPVATADQLLQQQMQQQQLHQQQLHQQQLQQQQLQQQLPTRTEPVVSQPTGVPALQPDGATHQPSSGFNVQSEATALVHIPQTQQCHMTGCTFTFTSTQVYHRHLNQMHPIPDEGFRTDEGRLSAISHVSYSSEFGDIHPYPVSNVLKYPDPDFEFPANLDESTFYSRTRAVAGYARSFKTQAKKFTNAFNANGTEDTKKRVFKELKVRFKKLVEERMHAEELLSPEQMENPKYTDFLVSYETMFEACEQQYLEVFPVTETPSPDIMESTHVDVTAQTRNRPSTTISEIPPTVDAPNLNSPQNQVPVSVPNQSTVPTRTGTVPRNRSVGFRFPNQQTGNRASSYRPVSGTGRPAGTSALGGVRYVNSAPRMNTGFTPVNRYAPPTSQSAFTTYRAPAAPAHSFPPASGYAAPAPGYAPAASGYAAPAPGYAPVASGYAAPPPGYAPPISGYAPPENVNMSPNMSANTELTSLAGAIHALAHSSADQNYDITRRIIKFDGTVSSYVKWIPIWEENYRHMKEQLNYSEYRIFNQFLLSMEEKVAAPFKHLDPSDATVQVVLEGFHSEFGTPDKLHHELNRKLKAFASEPLAMKDFDKAKIKLSTLQTLHQNFLDQGLISPDDGQSFIITAEPAMPLSFNREWAKYTERNSHRLCSSSEWMNQLQAYFRIESRTRASQASKPAKPEQSNQSNPSKNQQRNQQGSLPRSFATRPTEEATDDKAKPCIICSKSSHGAKRSLKCPELKNKTPQEVCDLIKKNRACFLCLLVGHAAKDCKSGLQACSKPGKGPDGKCSQLHCRAAHIDSKKEAKGRVHLTNDENEDQDDDTEESPAEETTSADT